MTSDSNCKKVLNSNNVNNISSNSSNRSYQSNQIVFKKLTLESINNIKENILNEKTRLEIEKSEAAINKNSEEETSNHVSKAKNVKSLSVKEGSNASTPFILTPNKDFEAGKILPKKYRNQFPQALAGRPIEEVDEFYKTDYVLILIF
jgi:hypothetical protein